MSGLVLRTTGSCAKHPEHFALLNIKQSPIHVFFVFIPIELRSFAGLLEAHVCLCEKQTLSFDVLGSSEV